MGGRSVGKKKDGVYVRPEFINLFPLVRDTTLTKTNSGQQGTTTAQVSSHSTDWLVRNTWPYQWGHRLTKCKLSKLTGQARFPYSPNKML